MVVVSAYDPGAESDAVAQTDGRRLLYGKEAARNALRRSVQEVTSDRVRNIEQVVVAEKPADALLRVAGNNPASLIVVGNRGLGAEEGDVLGSVPREIVRHAVCDVLVVQTSALKDM